MSTHFQNDFTKTDRLRRVLRVEDFADRYRLDDKQRRDLLKLFGQFATLQELVTNSRVPRDHR
ncbi:hypothetical protein QTL95_01555 [Rhizobium sp. S152]|uniref:hypothetical protein n=1 Tax=Rhizobium sp. S152 TaxID=3055038 RepID=UPI0025A9E666|nr:hypothetical protein [Rhizobium sp. S152]MDM9624563.1 hypothetical protein [Rhizobium sp. S152]